MQRCGGLHIQFIRTVCRDTRQEPTQTSLASAIPLFLAKILVWEEGKHTLKGTEPAWV